jgi:hypothetical protein
MDKELRDGEKLRKVFEDLYVTMRPWEAYAIAREMVRMAIDESRSGERRLAAAVTDAIVTAAVWS